MKEKIKSVSLDGALILILSVIFLFSGADKAFHYEGFVNALRNYVLVPRGTAPYLAMPVIAVELLVGAGLLLKRHRAAAALAAAALLSLFSLAVGFNHLYGARGICGCWFTITLAKGTGMHLAQNLLLAAIALVVWWEARPAAGKAPDNKLSLELSGLS